MRNAFMAAGLVAALATAGCTWDLDTTRHWKPDRTLGPAFAKPGSEWSYVRRDSGSFGNGVSQVGYKSLPVQTWQGRPHYAYEGPEGTLLIDPTSGSFAAQVKESKPLVSWDPPLGYHYPMWVGESWSTPFRMTNYANNRTSESRSWYTVEARENVNVPAGTFSTYRILYSTPTVWGHIWWSPELGIAVKTRLHRIDSDPAGPGTRESDLLRANVTK